ncbi:hypothetical protein [Streptomyces sp. NBC_00989]|uniref:hypothetical protein n=1 Tax=Streptomyces sp. NBC_00989 TaxID=2903705 RepID=UPI002F914812|nr:hypothetical protein OG714_54925 [Streptomyces sp. NBC_00989]
MAEITYRALLIVIAQLVAATNAEAVAAFERKTRIKAKAQDALNVGDRLVVLEFDGHTQRDVRTIADNFAGQAGKAVLAANAATDLNAVAQKAANAVRRNHGGIHNAVGSAPVAPAHRTAYGRL